MFLIGASTTSNSCLPWTVEGSVSEEETFGTKMSPISKTNGIVPTSSEIWKKGKYYKDNK